ncbi:MAG TPA: zinc ribbon domain-containing protein [Terriglobales bacterium]|nr:zinc ribbon domain-containing protein [Terriglobales bacterium]
MQAKNETQTALSGEIKIVPPWAWALAVTAFVAAQWYFNIALARQPHPPQAWARAGLGLLAGIGAGAYLLLIGYVNRDARRRGMSPTLWTLVAILIPNGMGLILYFILRQSLRTACPQCGNAVQTGFNFCPRCNYKLSPSCPQCQRVVGVNDVYCPYCGTSLRNQAAPVSGPPTMLPG